MMICKKHRTFELMRSDKNLDEYAQRLKTRNKF